MTDKKKDRPFVFVRCLTYNHEKYIEDALKGFVMQKTDFPFLAVVIDDCSTDGTADIVRRYEAQYPDIIKGIYLPHNFRQTREDKRPYYQEYIDKATYWAECEGDDYWTDPYKLQKQVNVLEKNSEVSICFTRVQPVSRLKQVLNGGMPPENSIKEGLFKIADFCREEYGKMQWVFQTSGALYRTIVVKDWKQSRIATNFPYSDMGVLILSLLHGNGYYISETMSCYRVDSGGYNSTMAANPERNIQQERKLADALRAFDEYTDKKYHKYIQQRIRLCEYREYTLGKKHHWRIIMPQYWRCLPGKTARQKTLSAIEIIAPNMRKRLKQMKNAIVHS